MSAPLEPVVLAGEALLVPVVSAELLSPLMAFALGLALGMVFAGVAFTQLLELILRRAVAHVVDVRKPEPMDLERSARELAETRTKR